MHESSISDIDMNNPDSRVQVDRHWLPSEDTTYFLDSTFFQHHTISDLPSTAEIEATSLHGVHRLVSFFPSLSLAVKMIKPKLVFLGPTHMPGPTLMPASIAEGQVLWALPRLLPQIRVPEVYGWRRNDDGGLSIFMELIDGETLLTMWPTLSEEEKKQLCDEAGTMIRSLRRLTRPTGETFIGAIGGQALGDRVFSVRVHEPFPNADAFYTHLTGLEPHMRESIHQVYPELILPYDDPFVFTHADIALCNIMVTRRQANVPLRIAAIIDWEQSGWLPLMWESFKAQAVRRYWPEDPNEKQYLATIAGTIADDVYLAFEAHVLSGGGF